MIGPDDDEDSQRLQKAIAFVLAMDGKGMPHDVFRGVFMDLLMPLSDPLRKCVW